MVYSEVNFKTKKALKEAVAAAQDAARREENEACAKVAEEYDYGTNVADRRAEEIAAAIRARVKP